MQADGNGVLAQLLPQDRELLWHLAEAAGPAARVALVGGAVRDALLGQTPLDLDVVVEGADVQKLAANSGRPFLFHPAFQNATLTLPDGRGLDLVKARQESYPVPGQNPVPRPGNLRQDLQRRDFSLNALALLLRAGGEAELLDVTGGLDDLRRKVLRPLHDGSLHEDASRLVRGARLAARLGLEAGPGLLAQVPAALAMAPSTPRLWAELKRMMTEPRPATVARKLLAWGAGEVLPDLSVWWALDALQDTGQEVTPLTYAAGYVAGRASPLIPPERLGLGEKPVQLLDRARSDAYFASGTAERQLRTILRPGSYAPLTGRDVLALGVPVGKGVGEALGHLAELRRSGRLASRQDEEEALRDYVKKR